MLDYKKLIIGFGVVLSVGCQDLTAETQGALVGGVLGGMVGDEIGNGSTEAVIAGTLIGSYVGEQVASSLKRYKNKKFTQTLEHGVSDRATEWSDPDANYIMVPEPVIRNNHGKICRPFRMTVDMMGEREIVHGKACRNEKGQWAVVQDSVYND
jgi:surface antigen